MKIRSAGAEFWEADGINWQADSYDDVIVAFRSFTNAIETEEKLFKHKHLIN